MRQCLADGLPHVLHLPFGRRTRGFHRLSLEGLIHNLVDAADEVQFDAFQQVPSQVLTNVGFIFRRQEDLGHARPLRRQHFFLDASHRQYLAAEQSAGA